MARNTAICPGCNHPIDGRIWDQCPKCQAVIHVKKKQLQSGTRRKINFALPGQGHYPAMQRRFSEVMKAQQKRFSEVTGTKS